MRGPPPHHPITPSDPVNSEFLATKKVIEDPSGGADGRLANHTRRERPFRCHPASEVSHHRRRQIVIVEAPLLTPERELRANPSLPARPRRPAGPCSRA